MGFIRRLHGRLFRNRPRSPGEAPDDEGPGIEELTGHTPRSTSWYRQALRHRSTLQNGEVEAVSNERLEFLGDAILGLVVASELFTRYPDADEGFLTKLRAKLVNGKTLAACARSIRLGEQLEISENMDRADGRTNRSILSDAYEALIGAIYLDLGLAAAREFVERTLFGTLDVDELALTRDNFKSLLLELSQANAWPQPAYDVLREEGPDHAKMFTMRVCIGDRELGTGTASSKKSAEQEAAQEALRRLNREISED